MGGCYLSGPNPLPHLLPTENGLDGSRWSQTSYQYICTAYDIDAFFMLFVCVTKLWLLAKYLHIHTAYYVLLHTLTFYWMLPWISGHDKSSELYSTRQQHTSPWILCSKPIFFWYAQPCDPGFASPLYCLSLNHPNHFNELISYIFYRLLTTGFWLPTHTFCMVQHTYYSLGCS